MLVSQTPAQIALAPMEGLVDANMRAILTQIGGIDWCVTEFIRITSTLLPAKHYYRLAPELLTQGKTASGVPVRIQLLGSHPSCLAENAARAAELGAPVIDLNFGCPAKCVNRHRGGAVLLQEPDLLYMIMDAVRHAVPASIPVTAKMRLGYLDTDNALVCAQALAQGGAAELVVHGRTKLQGYQAPAYWDWIGRIRESVNIPVFANGEIWTVADYWQARQESGCASVMLGRGLVGRPDLARQIQQSLAGEEVSEWSWSNFLPLLHDSWQQTLFQRDVRYAQGRLKLWLGYLRKTYPEADALFLRLRPEREAERISAILGVAHDDILK